MRKTKEQKRIEGLVDVACQNASYDASIPIMELGAVHAAVMKAALAGQDIEQAAIAAVAPYKNK